MPVEVIPGVGLSSDRLRLGGLQQLASAVTADEVFLALRLVEGDLTAGELLGSGGSSQGSSAVLTALLARGVILNLTNPKGPGPSIEAAMLDAPDPSALDLPADRQRELLDIEERVRSGDPYHLLGVSPEASVREVRERYFALAQILHPDQYFRRRLGTFQNRIDRLFAATTRAFQALTRPVSPPATTDGPPPDADGLPDLAGEALPELAMDEAGSVSIDAASTAVPKSGISGPPARGAEGRPRQRFNRALERQAFEEANEALLALATDEPNALDLPKLRMELTRRQSEAAGRAAFDRGSEAARRNDWAAAFSAFEQAATLDPRNAGYVERAARALLYQGEVREAKRLAERAVELKPDDADAHATLGKALLQAGLERNAKREFEVALKFDPKHGFARSQARRLWWKA